MRSGTARIGGVRIAYEVHGAGEPVLMMAGAAARSTIWHAHQTPALVAAGYQVVAFDHPGTAPSDVPPGPYRIDDLVAVAAGVLEHLGAHPCRVVGSSLGAVVAQELALSRPRLVTALALLGTCGRPTTVGAALARGYAAMLRARLDLPPEFEAATTALHLLSPRTLADDKVAADWLDLFRTFPMRGEGPAGQWEASVIPDRLGALAGITQPCLVVAFADDIITPPALCREVAAAIPESRYQEIPDSGHLGFVEQPQRVNAALLGFFRSLRPAVAAR